ncbi:MAG: transcription elongation factor spt5 [Chrysothrix sp. TS-e1954]|nr:MAG: transcription elongation factor spt5 [Chrysothrix sp. TS-e1954]
MVPSGEATVMKAIHLPTHLPSTTPLSALAPTSVPSPQASQATTDDPKVLVHVTHASLTHVDLLYARGLHQNNRSLVVPPFILGSEFAGVVLIAPAGCGLKPGDDVYGAASTGAFAEQIAIPASRLRKVPRRWSRREAAGLAATLPVAYGGLIRTALAKKGEVVLVHGASGGIGAMVCQVAKAVGCPVIATTRGAAKESWLRDVVGADLVVDTTREGWEAAVKAGTKVLRMRAGPRQPKNDAKDIFPSSGQGSGTEDEGVDVTFDNVGLVEQSIRCSRYGARVLICGFVGRGGAMEKLAMNRILLKGVQVIGYRYGEQTRRHPNEAQFIWLELERMMEHGQIEPIIHDQVFSGLESVGTALTALQDGKVLGKAVINIQAPPDHLADADCLPKL